MREMKEKKDTKDTVLTASQKNKLAALSTDLKDINGLAIYAN